MSELSMKRFRDEVFKQKGMSQDEAIEQVLATHKLTEGAERAFVQRGFDQLTNRDTLVALADEEALRIGAAVYIENARRGMGAQRRLPT